MKEAGWTIEHEAQQRRDALFATTMMFVISAAIMAAAAGTLFKEGVGLDVPAQMITLLKPIAGSFAVTLFAIGIIAAGVSSQFPNLVMLPWLICDYQNTERDLSKPSYRIVVFFLSLLGLVVPIFDARPVLVLILSQAFNVVLLPVTVACILYLGNRVDLMGHHRNDWKTNTILAMIFLFSLLIGYMAFQGLTEMLRG